MRSALVLIGSLSIIATGHSAFAATTPPGPRICTGPDAFCTGVTKKTIVGGGGNGSAPDPYERIFKNVCAKGFTLDCATSQTLCMTRGSSVASPLDAYARLRGTRNPFQYYGVACGSSAAPAIPTWGQIQSAFRELPFAKPSVSIQPVGNVTLVNLPTYYHATWPSAGLSPGEISQPVQLLSWSVEFKIAPATYDYSFGDGTRSGPTTDPGGTYPNGGITHTYLRTTLAAAVKVDARLTGWYRVNGGQWQDVDGAADLQNEPVTTLAVKQAVSRLYTG